MSLRALGRLLRLSLSVTAAADVAAGVVVGARTWPGGAGPWLLVGASLCVYHGGMALNDWADRDQDARARPDRPIPSGAIPPHAALALGLALLALGPALAWLAAPRAGLVLGGVAAAALAYDLGPRGPWLGPVLLGSCRAGNLAAGLLLGLAASGQPPALPAPLGPWLLPVGYGLYVLVVSRLGRLEDAQDRLEADPLRPRRLLLGAAVLLLVPAALALATAAGRGWPAAPALVALVALVLGGTAAAGLARVALRTHRWSPDAVVAAMGMALRRLLAFTASAAVATPAHGVVVAALILLGYPLSHALRRVFPPS